MWTSSGSKPDRGGCLNLWLGASVVFSILAIVLFLGLGEQLTRRGLGFFLIFGIVAVIVNLACIYGIYQWKRWGVYGLIGASLVSLVLNVIGGTVIVTTFVSPFVQMAILWYLVHDKWDVFD